MRQSLIGKTIDKYQIVEHLGRGGMAEVFKAYQPTLDRYVAIKLMHSFLADDPDFLGRFQREAKAVASLRHPNIVRVYDFDVADGLYYMVMEFIDGHTLKARLVELAAARDLLPREEALHISAAVASALAYAHRRDMVHRDIKPANVMINSDGQVILTDFGIAKILSGPQFTASGAMLGTPAYMSPEQGLGEPGDARSDIYALGVMLFQMVTGQLPFDADTPLAIVLKHVNDPLPIPSQINPSLPAEIERVILKAMAKDPDHRFQTAEEFIEHLDRSKASLPGADTLVAATRPGQQANMQAATVLAPRAGASPTVAQPHARAGGGKLWPWLVGLGAISIVAIVAVLGMLGVFKSGTGSATPTATLLAAVAPTVEPTTPPSTSTPSHTAEPEATAIDPIDAASTALARQNATLTAQAPTLLPPTATSTQTPTPTPTATPSPTPSPTPTADCDYAYEMVAYYVYDDPGNYDELRGRTVAPSNTQFPFSVQILNQSTCPWPEDIQLVLLSGNALKAETAIRAGGETEPSATAEFSTRMISGDEAGLMTSIWALEFATGSPIGDPLEINVLVYEPATPTPYVAPLPTATPSPEADTGPIEFNHFIHDCEYAGDQWRCWMTLTPYGGIGQPYTFFIFDADQPTRYYGGNQDHLIQSRRCFLWVHEIKLQDDAGNSMSRNVSVSPHDHFEGGCTEP
jgi:hypothetical protein